MNKKYAGLSSPGVCVLLAILSLTNTIAPIVSGLIFAVALILFGNLLRGFRRT